MSRSNSRDTYLSVPGRRERGTSLTESPGHNEADLYRLREFTVSNKKIVKHTESLQFRSLRSNNSINSSGSRYLLTLCIVIAHFQKEVSDLKSTTMPLTF